MQSARSVVPKLKSRMGTAANIEYGKEDKTAPKDSWPKALWLRAGAFTQKMDLIRAVCHEVIRIVEKTLVMQHAWPELHKGMHYKWQVLLEAIKVLQAKNLEDDEGKQDAQYKALNIQLLNNEKFVRCIGKWVCLSPSTSRLDILVKWFI